MVNNRPSKRERMAMSALGHLHSPPVKASLKRRDNLAQGTKGIAFRSLTPSVLSKAAAKSPHVKAYVNLRGQGQGSIKPKVTPKDKSKFQGDVPYVLGDTLVDMADERAKVISPERKYRMADTKKRRKRHGFRKFNKAGIA